MCLWSIENTQKKWFLLMKIISKNQGRPDWPASLHAHRPPKSLHRSGKKGISSRVHGFAHVFSNPNPIDLFWIFVQMPLKLDVKCLGWLANPMLSIFMSLLLEPAVSPRHCPHTCCCRLLRCPRTSQRSGIPGSVHAVETPTHSDHAVVSKTRHKTNERRVWYFAAVAWDNGI